MKSKMEHNEAYGFAKEKHDATGVLYNGVPYFEGHVDRVIKVLARFGFDSPLWVARGASHDVIEDCNVTREFLRGLFGIEVELPVWCVTGIGENRKARNANIYSKIIAYGTIMDDEAPAILKCCDRIVHFESSESGSGHRKMYVKEFDGFTEVIKPRVPVEMWNYLQGIAVE